MLSRCSAIARRGIGRRMLASGAGEDEASQLKTALYDWHLEHGGKMVPFAGYSLPVQYTGLGVLKGIHYVNTARLSIAS